MKSGGKPGGERKWLECWEGLRNDYLYVSKGWALTFTQLAVKHG